MAEAVPAARATARSVRRIGGGSGNVERRAVGVNSAARRFGRALLVLLLVFLLGPRQLVARRLRDGVEDLPVLDAQVLPYDRTRLLPLLEEFKVCPLEFVGAFHLEAAVVPRVGAVVLEVDRLLDLI